MLLNVRRRRIKTLSIIEELEQKKKDESSNYQKEMHQQEINYYENKVKEYDKLIKLLNGKLQKGVHKARR